MADNQQNNDSSHSDDRPDTKPTSDMSESHPLPTASNSSKDTNKLPEPVMRSDVDAEELEATTALHIVTRRDDDSESFDPTRETAILSRNHPGLRRALNNQATANDGPTKMGEKREVILLIRGMVERINVAQNDSFVIGRFEMGAEQGDEIDLTPYGALDRGVSRLHARIHLESDQLYVTDLGSTNGTYLGGNRLTANEPTILRKGDELLLGRLAIQILFR